MLKKPYIYRLDAQKQPIKNQNPMKKSMLFLLSLAVLMVACKSKEMVAVEEEPPAPIVEVAPEPEPLPEPEPETVRMVEERFTFDRNEDRATHDANTFFVIVGSFIQKENADRFMETLRGQGFSPVILVSETGFNRVSVASFEQEMDARRRVQQIRNNYPAYHDTWLLIRKQ